VSWELGAGSWERFGIAVIGGRNGIVSFVHSSYSRHLFTVIVTPFNIRFSMFPISHDIKNYPHSQFSSLVVVALTGFKPAAEFCAKESKVCQPLSVSFHLSTPPFPSSHHNKTTNPAAPATAKPRSPSLTPFPPAAAPALCKLGFPVLVGLAVAAKAAVAKPTPLGATYAVNVSTTCWPSGSCVVWKMTLSTAPPGG